MRARRTTAALALSAGLALSSALTGCAEEEPVEEGVVEEEVVEEE